MGDHKSRGHKDRSRSDYGDHFGRHKKDRKRSVSSSSSTSSDDDSLPRSSGKRRSRSSSLDRRRAKRSRSDESEDRSRSRSNERSRRESRSKDRTRKRSRERTKKQARSSSRSKERSRSRKSRSRSKGRSRRSRSSSEGHTSHTSSKSREKKKKKSKKKRSRSKSPAQVLTASEIERLKEEKKKQKELMKALETPEEKRARRLAKKEAKERKRKANMGWDEEYMGYTNADNPFGDEHLLDTFVWGKKLQKEGLTDIDKREIEKMQKQKMIENKLELEKVKKRRIEREKEREERENEREMMQREKEAEYFKTWENQEDSFHLQQAKLRSTIRIKDGRAKPIDLLAKYINADEDDFDVEMHEPYTYLNGLTAADLEDLLEDIKVYLELEQSQNTDYWKDITIVTEDELSVLKKMDPTSRDYVGDRRSGINQSVNEDVAAIFKGKTLAQLRLLEQSIAQKLCGGEGVDVGYWESLLQQLKAHMARQRLRERHQELLRRKLFKLKQQQGITESAPLFPIVSQDDSNGPSTSTSQQPTAARAAEKEAEATKKESSEEEEEEGDEAVLTEEDLVDQSVVDYQSGGYSPKLISINDLEPDTILYDPKDDILRLEFARKSVLQTGQAQRDSDDELMRKAREGMTGEEASFSVQVPLEKQSLLWSDKYRPRKPRFFNRVHTGFEWNKYNQTHYDIDNPPPKIVQGYKFNIFYPDLIDKTKPPEYTLTPCEGNKDFAILRFHAGPPYEDIAFKIVNREWEYSYKRGFRCQFHNNIFQLWYHFKRYRYRR